MRASPHLSVVSSSGAKKRRHAPIDVLPAACPRDLFLVLRPVRHTARDDRMLACRRRVRDPLANGFEDFGFAQLGHEQSERQRLPARMPPRAQHVRAGSRTPFDQPGVLKIAEVPAHGDSRGAEGLDELGLARQPLDPKLDRSATLSPWRAL